MAACKLYIRFGGLDTYLGCFRNKEKVEEHYRIIRPKLETQYGTGVVPIYVESRK